MKRKTGPITISEREEIVKHLDAGLGIPQVALKMNRSEATIRKQIQKHNLTGDGMPEQEQEFLRLRRQLHAKRYWQELANQFTVTELNYFEALWTDLMLQFREDVKPSEELQIKQLVTIEILLNRSMKERKKQVEEIERLQIDLDNLYKVDEGSRDNALLSMLEQQISYMRNSISAYTNEYVKLLSEQKSIQKDLKSTRDQRIKRIEDSKSSFSGWLKSLEDEAERERLGHGVAVMKIAKEKAKERLGEWHVYQNGEADQPLLTPENVKLDGE